MAASIEPSKQSDQPFLFDLSLRKAVEEAMNSKIQEAECEKLEPRYQCLLFKTIQSELGRLH